MEKLKGKDYFSFGIGNVASQLSWTMVSSYLTLFYTDVFAAGTCCICISTLCTSWKTKESERKEKKTKKISLFLSSFFVQKERVQILYEIRLIL